MAESDPETLRRMFKNAMAEADPETLRRMFKVRTQGHTNKLSPKM